MQQTEFVRMYHQSQTYGAPRVYTEPHILHPTSRPMPDFLKRATLVRQTSFEDGPYGPNGRFYNIPTPPHQYDSRKHGVMPEINWSHRLASHDNISHHNHPHRMPHVATPVSTNHMHENIKRMQIMGSITHNECFILLDESQANKGLRNDLLQRMRDAYKISEPQMANYS